MGAFLTGGLNLLGTDQKVTPSPEAIDGLETSDPREVQEIKHQTVEDRFAQSLLDNVRPLIRFLGVPRQALYSAVDFVPYDHLGVGPQPYVRVDESSGAWKEAHDGGACGCDLFSLVQHVLKLSQDQTDNVIKNFLDACTQTVGLEFFPEFGLCNDEGCMQVVPVPEGVSPPPQHRGDLYDCPQDFPLRTDSGRLLGYSRVAEISSQRDALTGLPVRHTVPLTYWEGPNGISGWKSRYVPAPYPLFGVEKLALDPVASVVLTDDELSTECPLPGFATTGHNEIRVSFISAPDSFKNTDLTPLAERTVYVLATRVEAEKIREKLWRINPRTRVGIIKVAFREISGPFCPLFGDRSLVLDEHMGTTLGWSLNDYYSAGKTNRWELEFIIEPPVFKHLEIEFDDFRVDDSEVDHRT